MVDGTPSASAAVPIESSRAYAKRKSQAASLAIADTTPTKTDAGTKSEQVVGLPVDSCKPTAMTPGVHGDLNTLELIFSGSHESEARVKYMTKYAEFLMKPAVKIVVLVVFFAATAVSTYVSFYVLESKFEQSILVPDDSYVRDFFNLQDHLLHKDTGDQFTEVYYRVVDYHKPEVQ